MKNCLLAVTLALSLKSAIALEAPVTHIQRTVAGGILLSWTPVSGADSYAVYSLTLPYSAGVLLDRVSANQYECAPGAIESGFYYVIAEDTVPGAAPHPLVPADSVISLFSNAYTNVPVGAWSTDWDGSDVADIQIEGNDTKLYSNFSWAAIDFSGQTIDATAMTRFHMDLWTPDPTAAPAFFRIKLVDFGANGSWGGGDDVEHELVFDSASTPPLQSGSWIGFDLPLAAFTGLVTRGHLAQLILSASSNPDINTLYVDNVYLWDDGTVIEPPQEPTVAAPTPTVPAVDVLSMFSNAYDNVPVDSWSMFWDNANVADVQVAGNDTKLYSSLVFAGVEFANPTIDATDMTRFHMDIWTPNPTAAPVTYRVKLVDYGSNGVWGGGDDVEHELSFDDASTPPLQTGTWVSLDVPLTSFIGLATRGHLAQLIISGGLSTVYVDNVYFWDDGSVIQPPAEPTAPAPTPTYNEATVISMFSNAYSNVAVDTWSAGWDQASVVDMQILGNDTKHYTGVVYAGIEFTAAPVNATDMGYFRMDFWTPDPTATPAQFGIKLVDFGANGIWGGGDDTESTVWINSSSTPPLQTGNWVSFDIPLSAFGGLAARGHLAQMVIEGIPSFYIDNVLFHQ